MNAIVTLRKVRIEDLDIFFEQQKDPDSNWMAAFISRNPKDRAAFENHWKKIQNNEMIHIRTILHNEKVAGNIVSFIMDEKREIGYWIGKEFWGKGIATEALELFVEELSDRPLFAHVAFDNVGSIKVLEKNGFERFGDDTYMANARGEEITEYIYRLT